VALVVGARTTLSSIEADYAAAVEAAGAASFSTSVYGLTPDTKEQVDWAYSNRILNKRSRAREYYNLLRLNAPDGICPNCAVRDSAALDHYLPREIFPELAIQPLNLVPICTACNTAKSANVSTASSDQFLHPYFDDLGTSRWLVAQVVQQIPTATTFSIARATEWDDVLYARVIRHFERYDLPDLFAKKSAGLLANHRLAFETLFAENPDEGARIVSREALRLADSHGAAGVNPWKSAAFRAWSESDWFCNGGWRIPDDVALEMAYDRISRAVS
jgi:hypothetical protein